MKKTEMPQRSARSTTTPKPNEAVLIEPLKGWPTGEAPIVLPQSDDPPSDAPPSADAVKGQLLSDDQAKLLRYDAHLRRGIRVTIALMIVEFWLAIGAAVAAVFATTSWPFIVWLAVECVLLLQGAIALRQLRRRIYWLQMDLAYGVVQESVGRVRSFRVFGRVIEDSKSGRRYLIEFPLFRPLTVRLGRKVSYRAAAQSRVVLSLRNATT